MFKLETQLHKHAILIYPVTVGNFSIKYYVQKEDTFGKLHDAHLAIGHGGWNRRIKETQTKYKNITAEYIMIYFCVPCIKKSKVPTKRFSDQANDI